MVILGIRFLERSFYKYLFDQNIQTIRKHTRSLNFERVDVDFVTLYDVMISQS